MAEDGITAELPIAAEITAEIPPSRSDPRAGRDSSPAAIPTAAYK